MKLSDGRHSGTTEVEEVVDPIMGREEALRLAGCQALRRLATLPGAPFGPIV